MNRWVNTLRWLVRVLAGIAGAALLTMMLVTAIDAILCALQHPIPGAFDLAKVAPGVAIACGLPYTTAVKGHVAVEYFFHRLGRPGQGARPP